jgi:hypothetical protein
MVLLAARFRRGTTIYARPRRYPVCVDRQEDATLGPTREISTDQSAIPGREGPKEFLALVGSLPSNRRGVRTDQSVSLRSVLALDIRVQQ